MNEEFLLTIVIVNCCKFLKFKLRVDCAEKLDYVLYCVNHFERRLSELGIFIIKWWREIYSSHLEVRTPPPFFY